MAPRRERKVSFGVSEDFEWDPSVATWFDALPDKVVIDVDGGKPWVRSFFNNQRNYGNRTMLNGLACLIFSLDNPITVVLVHMDKFVSTGVMPDTYENYMNTHEVGVEIFHEAAIMCELQEHDFVFVPAGYVYHIYTQEDRSKEGGPKWRPQFSNFVHVPLLLPIEHVLPATFTALLAWNDAVLETKTGSMWAARKAFYKKVCDLGQ